MTTNGKIKPGRPLTVHPGERYGMLTVLVRVEDGPPQTGSLSVPL